jgi:hypothetical protein
MARTALCASVAFVLTAARATAQSPGASGHRVEVTVGTGSGPDRVFIGRLAGLSSVGHGLNIGVAAWGWHLGTACEAYYPNPCGQSGFAAAATGSVGRKLPVGAGFVDGALDGAFGIDARDGDASPMTALGAGLRFGTTLGITARGEWMRIFDSSFSDEFGESLSFKTINLGVFYTW